MKKTNEAAPENKTPLFMPPGNFVVYDTFKNSGQANYFTKTTTDTGAICNYTRDNLVVDLNELDPKLFKVF